MNDVDFVITKYGNIYVACYRSEKARLKTLYHGVPQDRKLKRLRKTLTEAHYTFREEPAND